MHRLTFAVLLATSSLLPRLARSETFGATGEARITVRHTMPGKGTRESLGFFAEFRQLESRGPDTFRERISHACLGFDADKPLYQYGTCVGLIRLTTSEEKIPGWFEDFHVRLGPTRVALTIDVLIGMPFNRDAHLSAFFEARYGFRVRAFGQENRGQRFWFGIHVDERDRDLMDGVDFTYAFGHRASVKTQLALNTALSGDVPDWGARLNVAFDFE